MPTAMTMKSMTKMMPTAMPMKSMTKMMLTAMTVKSMTMINKSMANKNRHKLMRKTLTTSPTISKTNIPAQNITPNLKKTGHPTIYNIFPIK